MDTEAIIGILKTYMEDIYHKADNDTKSVGSYAIQEELLSFSLDPDSITEDEWNIIAHDCQIEESMYRMYESLASFATEVDYIVESLRG